jgi:2-keto-3-deoxy-galactonokinase
VHIDAVIPCNRTAPPEIAMNLKTLDSFLQRAVSLGLAMVVTLGMLGSIDRLAQAPYDEAPAGQMAATPAAPRG